jgi:hypothetical protein
VLALILTVPISVFYVAAWRLDPSDGFAMIGLGFISLWLFAYLPWVVWLAYRVAGLSLGWLAGLLVTLSYLLGVLAWGYEMTPRHWLHACGWSCRWRWWQEPSGSRTWCRVRPRCGPGSCWGWWVRR